MPLLVTYAGRPVKRRVRAGDGLCLFLFSPIPGQPSERLVVTQDDWDAHGKISFFAKDQMPDVRKLASQPNPILANQR